MARRITDLQLKNLQGKLSEPADREGKAGYGTLIFERRSSGVVEAYYRQRIENAERRLKIGAYKRDARAAGMSLAELRDRANEYARIAAEHGDVAGYIEALKEQARAADAARKRQAELEARRGSFADLLDTYVAALIRDEKTSADAVRQILDLHVKTPNPSLMELPAAEIRPEDIQAVLAGVLKRKPKRRGRGNKSPASASNGMRTTADKVRRYLQAAFSCAAKAHLAPERLAENGKIFSISANPVRDVPVIEGTGGGNRESLLQDEFAELLRYIEALPERHRAIAQSFIYLGGQRLRQLCPVPWERIEPEMMILIDPKGRKRKPWEHLLPITPRIAELMQPLLRERIGPGPFSLQEGRTVHPDTLSGLFRQASKELLAAGKVRRTFSWADIRVTVETLMAAQGISREVRAWLLSHGRSGVQEKHYDRYSYLPEKREALERWGDYLDRLARGEPVQSVVLLGGRYREAALAM